MIALSSLGLEDALTIIDGARAHAQQRSLRLTIVVLGADGAPVALARMDGALTGTTDAAMAKARAALAFGLPSKRFEEAGNAGRISLALLPGIVDGLALEGGFPVFVDGALVGAAAASGASAAQDAAAVEAGIGALLGGA